MDFCPSCGKRLVPLKKPLGNMVALLLTCPQCGYEKGGTRPVVIASKIIERSPQESISVIDKKQQKLRALAKVRIKCPKYGNGSAYAWVVQIRGL